MESRPEAMTFHHRRWHELLCDHYGFKWRALALDEGGSVAAAAPFLETRSPMGGRKLSSLPFSDFVGPLATSPAHGEGFWSALVNEELNAYSAVVLRTGGAPPPVPCSQHWVRHTVNLAERTDPRFPSSVRRNLRRAESQGLAFAVSRDRTAMEAFYDLHVMTRRKLGVPVQTRRFFRRLHDYLIAPGLGFVATVKKGPQVVAAAVFLGFGQTLVYKYGASHPKALADRPNELLFARVLRVAVEKDYGSFDFGATRASNEGLRRFKRKWGSVERPVYHAYVHGAPSRPSGDGPVHRLAGTVIRRSPRWVCRALGAALYRYAS